MSQLVGANITVRALTRNPESADLPRSVQVVRGDYSDPRSLEKSLNDVDRVFLLWPGLATDLAQPVLETIARSARRIVYLSSLSVRDDQKRQIDPISAFHADLERMIEESGMDWTILRCSGFATNTLGWARQIRSGNMLRWPYARAARSLIHEGDIASVAAKALTSNQHGHAKYLITGPNAITQIEQLTVIADSINRSLRYEEVSPDVARRELFAFWPPSIVESILNSLNSFQKEPEMVTRTVEEITGTPPLSFSHWARGHSNDFR